MQEIYENGSYLGNNPSWHEEDSPWKAEQVFRILEANKIVPNTVCELGCGAGEILRQLSDRMAAHTEFSGYDISPQAIDSCKAKARENLRFFQVDLLEEKDSMFDVLMAIDVFEHVEDYVGFLRQMRSKGIYKVFHIPLDLSVQTVLRSSPILKGRRTVGHLHYFTKDTALAVLADAGYEILDYCYTGKSIDMPNRRWQAKVMSLPRKLLFALNRDLTVRVLGGWSLLVLAK